MKIGRFSVEDEIRKDVEVAELLSLMNILREAPSMTIAGVTEILAKFDEFDDIDNGQVIPEYQFIFDRQPSGEVTRRKAERI